MPYEGERAPYRSVRRIVENERVKELLGKYEIKKRDPSDGSTNLELLPLDKLPISTWRPDWILAIDGSYLPVDVENGYPGAETGYLTISSVLIDMKKLRELDSHRPVNPQAFQEIEVPQSIDWAIPSTNVVYAGEKSARASLRRSVFELFSSIRMAGDDGESLLDTYEYLLDMKPPRSQRCPIEGCPVADDLAYYRNHGQYQCNCELGSTYFSTDALRFHERFNPHGKNGMIFAEIMQVVERLWLVNILRTLERKGWLSSLRRVAVMLDGPLAVFGQPAWISHAIAKELARLNSVARGVLGNKDIVLLGIEKTGHFADHFERIDTTEEGQEGKFPSGHCALLSDSYIKEHIQYSESSKPFGQDTYFGRKLLYKTTRNARIVANFPFYSDYHQDTSVAREDQYPRLVDALALLEETYSSRYPHAVMPIVAANAEAAIPLHLGKQILEKLARELATNGM